MRTPVQQGDLLMTPIDKLSDEGKSISVGKCILAHGESSHSHVVEDEEAELIQIGERMLLKLGRQATVKHEEHGPIALAPGIWEIGRVNEYDYFKDMVRKVQD
jgi:hypothetical protein